MSFAPLSQAFPANSCSALQLIATDMDGTLTSEGKFSSELLQALEALSSVGLKVLIVTGRSAGWVSGLVHYLPIWGAIAENGGLFYPGSQLTGKERFLVPIGDIQAHRQQLAACFQQLQAEFPQIQESQDNRFRLTDWTFDIQDLTNSAIQTLSQRCQERGWGFTYSTVQCHIKLPNQDKAAGLRQVMQQYLADCTPAHTLTVGDSPNDESLFDCSQFPWSIGVANLRDYVPQLRHLPQYITSAPEGRGFIELAQVLLEKRQ